MSQAHPFRRFVPLVMAMVALAGLQCHPAVAPQPVTRPPLAMADEPELTQEQMETFCQQGNYSKGRPLICIDNDTLQAHPDPARMWDVEGYLGRPTNVPVVIHWFTKRTANLSIQFQSGSACVGAVHCNGSGRCVAVVERLGPGEEQRQCKYDVIVDGQRNDPDVVINPCCW